MSSTDDVPLRNETTSTIESNIALCIVKEPQSDHVGELPGFGVFATHYVVRQGDSALFGYRVAFLNTFAGFRAAYFRFSRGGIFLLWRSVSCCGFGVSVLRWAAYYLSETIETAPVQFVGAMGSDGGPGRGAICHRCAGTGCSEVVARGTRCKLMYQLEYSRFPSLILNNSLARLGW